MKNSSFAGKAAAGILVIALAAAVWGLCVRLVSGAGINVLVGDESSAAGAPSSSVLSETPALSVSSLVEAIASAADSGISDAESVAEAPEEEFGMMGGVHAIAEIEEIVEIVPEPGVTSGNSETEEMPDSAGGESEAGGEESTISEVEETESGESAVSEVEETESGESVVSKVEETESGESAVSEVEETESGESAISEIEEVETTGGAQEIRLGFAGDINFDEEWATTKFMDEQGGILSVFSENLVELMRGFDIFMLNNEFTYSTRGEKVDKSYNFRADPARVENLHTIGVDIVLLANNHVFDYGEDALLDTFETLEEAGIPYVGAGRNISEAVQPYYFTVNGHKIAYVAASSAEEYTPSIATRAATADEAGILACYDPTLFLQAIAIADENADFVIANVHWGMEYDDQYYDNQRELAERMVAAGADAVIGTHTHCLQGINFIDGVPVFYSLGNYWFNDKDLYTGVAELTLRVPDDPDEPIELENTKFYPCTQYGLFTNMPTDQAERGEILSYLQGISHDLVSIDAEGNVRDAA